ncbi:hypothetical protein DV452_002023 [Geotrichum candidum]|mgnify:CR=1 FL=1|nr:hypothetical protein DV453_003669 [Geotrichum candidum]KAF5113770.1 hypothetical protein DV454_003388 [Geotrichum candidum]KAF5118507.1 hypothetical protein DV452_002023 [Geotrichum candidum]KAI8133260.1 hypothetical protein DUD61_003092 [Geotrichum candidum]KAI9213184.1 hypothetical protein DS838_001908 [Geotrichum bryndzae]
MLNPNNTAAKLPAGYVEDASKGPMLRFQESLPHLPVPSLEETAAKYLRSVIPLVTPDEFARTEAAVKDFIRPGGAGQQLQKKLEARASDPSIKNWLYDWWNDAAYLTYRDPVVPYVSYFYSHKDDKLRKNPVTRAAAITTAALAFKAQVDNKTLEPEYMKKLPLCMDSYKYMFNVSRVPLPGRDDAVSYDPNTHKHIIVIRHNRFFKILHEVNGKQLSTAEFEAQLQKVYEATEGQPKATPIGALTSENRDKWVKYRELLIAADPSRNGAALEDIESASFVVALDDAKPVTREERAHQYWHGDGQNRFYDKPLQFVICDNGVSGFLGEHSMMDGTPTHRLNDYVNDVIFNNKVDHGAPASANRNLPDPVEVVFTINTDVKEAVDTAVKDFKAVIGEHELAVFAYKGYGKGLIKKFKSSPDAYVQMLIQLAYYKCFGVVRPTYESAATRRFQLGRTETCRSVSVESLEFVKTFEDPKASPAQKIAAARKAFNAHVKYISDASAGKGVDRHLFGLSQLVEPGQEVPAIFKDPTFTYSKSWYLSTSQLSSEYFNGYGWSQVIDAGFGLAYMINENSIQVNVVSKKLGVERMRYFLEEAADDLAEVFSTELANKAKL